MPGLLGDCASRSAESGEGHAVRLLWECMRLPAPANENEVHAADLPKRNGNGHNGNGHKNGNGTNGNGHNGHKAPAPWQVVRTPGDERCCARRRDGERCRGRARTGSDYCLFHDPLLTVEKRRAIAVSGGKSRRRRVRLPRGYPRNLDCIKSVQRAMNRLYREVRAGMIDPMTGRTLLDVLSQAANVHEPQKPGDETARRVARVTRALDSAVKAVNSAGTRVEVPAPEQTGIPVGAADVTEPS